MLTASDVLGPHGLLSVAIPHFKPRLQQQEMANVIADALANGHVLIAEAGTGTGKTFAYLVPALLAGKTIVISTGTKTLQDQLFHRDLPTVRRALGIGVQVALLKGRANYLCLQRLQVISEEVKLHPFEHARALQRIEDWARITTRGDISEVIDIAEDGPIWPYVTSTPDNCLGQDCPLYADCHVVAARRHAQEADIIVVNHHLLFADMTLREEGFGEILPGVHGFIIDEAHQLPDLASQCFGTSSSSRQLLELTRDTAHAIKNEAYDMQDLVDKTIAVENAVHDVRHALGDLARRTPWHEVNAQNPALEVLWGNILQHLARLAEALDIAAVRGKALDNCAKRAKDVLQRWGVLTATATDDFVHWLETHARTFSIHRTPIEAGNLFRSHMEAYKAAWIFTSATLAVGGNFTHFNERMGLDRPHTAIWDSPFDYANHALLYVPSLLPEPNTAAYMPAVIEAAIPVLQASEGRAFVLFTSHRALKFAAELLKKRTPYPLFVQGTMPRAELLRQFCNTPQAVLLGTGSFWEGVDVRGAGLSCVIIDKLPFAAPDDPVLRAKIEWLKRNGGNPFQTYQLPQAVITLKQGVGRLIRDENDRGVLMLCDPRLYTKFYGKIFLDSLPPMRRTRELADVENFFSEIE